MHKMIEAIKLAYGERAKLGDEDFVPQAKEVMENDLFIYIYQNVMQTIESK